MQRPNPQFNAMPQEQQVAPGTQTRTPIQEPAAQMMEAGMGLMTAAIPNQSPEEREAWRKMDNAIANRFQTRWWKAQADQFEQTKGAEYRRNVQNLQIDYENELAGAADAKDDLERAAMIRAAGSRMWQALGSITQQHGIDGSNYPNNPIIAQNVFSRVDGVSQTVKNMMGAGKEATEQVRLEAETGAARGRESASRAQAAKTTLEAEGPYGTKYRDAAEGWQGDSQEFVEFAGEQARDEIEELSTSIAKSRWAKLDAERTAIAKMEEGPTKSAAEDRFFNEYGVYFDDIGTKRGTEGLQWYRLAASDSIEKEAADRYVSKLRGPDPFRPATRKLGVVSAGAGGPGEEGKFEREAPPQIPTGATPEERTQIAQELVAKEMGPLPDYNLAAAAVVIGGKGDEEAKSQQRADLDSLNATLRAYGKPELPSGVLEDTPTTVELANRLFPEGLRSPAEVDKERSRRLNALAKEKAGKKANVFQRYGMYLKKRMSGPEYSRYKRYLADLAPQVETAMLRTIPPEELPVSAITGQKLTQDEARKMSALAFLKKHNDQYPDMSLTLPQFFLELQVEHFASEEAKPKRR